MSRALPVLRASSRIQRFISPVAQGPSFCRAFHSSPIPHSGLQNIFETSDLPSLSVTKLTARGFHLTDDLVVPGGLVLVGGRALIWDVDPPSLPAGGTIVDAWKGWTKERFEVFSSVVPRPEILLFGTGKQVIPAPKEIKDYVSGLGIQLDVMDSVSSSAFHKPTIPRANCLPIAEIPAQCGINIQSPDGRGSDYRRCTMSLITYQPTDRQAQMTDAT